ncbi:MAG: hypothetical protein V3V99_09220 [candidate division Zixibacteria bacterium]
MDNDIKEKLYNLDWESILPKLYAYAYAYCNYPGMQASTSPEDLVNEAVLRVLSGKRKWDPHSDPDILIFMKFSVIKSMTNQAWNSVKKRKECYNKITEKESENTAQRKMDEHDREELYKGYMDEIEDRLKDNDDLLLLFYATQEGNYSNIDLAKALGKDVKDVCNMKKRMGRKIADLKKIMEK